MTMKKRILGRENVMITQCKNWIQIDTVPLGLWSFLNHYHIISDYFYKDKHENEALYSYEGEKMKEKASHRSRK